MVVRITPFAKVRLKEIFGFCAQTGGQRYALKTTLTIREYIAALAQMPHIAARELSLESEPENFRSLVIARRYKAIYYIDEVRETIVVIDIWDCRQDPTELKQRTIKQTSE